MQKHLGYLKVRFDVGEAENFLSVKPQQFDSICHMQLKSI